MVLMTSWSNWNTRKKETLVLLELMVQMVLDGSRATGIQGNKVILELPQY
jgi:hypothetical protein